MSLARVVPFQGDDFDPTRDGKRLGAQLQRVYNVMKDGRWYSHQEIVEILMWGGKPREKEASIARQVRYLRDIPGCDVRRRHDGEGLYRYRMVFTKEQRGLGI